jgi:hypothetical protein
VAWIWTRRWRCWRSAACCKHSSKAARRPLARLVDRLVLYVGSRTLGEAGRPLFAGQGPTTIAQAGRWRLLGARQLGDDIRLEYEALASLTENEVVI